MAGRGRLALPWARAVRFALMTAVIAFVVTLPAQSAAAVLGPPAAIPLVLVIVGLAILSDMIGVAATRAAETPFVARAAKRRPGAREGLTLVRNADLVATVASDLVGDLAGTISGAMLAIIVLDLGQGAPLALKTALAVALLTAATIGAKAVAKAYAVRHAEDIVQIAGHGLFLLKRLLPNKAQGRRPGG